MSKDVNNFFYKYNAHVGDVDVTLRGAVSIARRLQDPLAELVKMDPKAIGGLTIRCGAGARLCDPLHGFFGKYCVGLIPGTRY